MASIRRQTIRGSTLELDQDLGLEGLLAYDSDLRNLRIYDGVTLGGIQILTAPQIAALYTLPARLTASGDTLNGLSANAAITNGWYRTTATTTDLPAAAVGVLEVSVADTPSGAISQVWTRNSTGYKYFRSKVAGGAWNAWQRFVDLNFLTTDPTAKAYDADRLDGNDSAYYTDIVARLGYTPLNKAGDGVIGNLTVGGTLGVTGNTTLAGTLGVTGSVTLTNSLTVNGANGVIVNGASPTIKLNDTDASADDFWINANADIFYVLTDRGDDGTTEAPNPLELRNATALGFIYGNQIVTTNMYGAGNGINADMVDGVHAASFATVANLNSGAQRAYGLRSDGAAINWIWSGQPLLSWGWMSNDGQNMYPVNLTAYLSQYTQTTDPNFNQYPVGSYVLSRTDPSRNQALNVWLTADGARFNSQGTGTLCAGTWSAKGGEDQSGARQWLLVRIS